MAVPDRRRRSRSGQLRDAVVWGTVLGAASGAVLGDAIDGVGAGGCRGRAARVTPPSDHYLGRRAAEISRSGRQLHAPAEALVVAGSDYARTSR